MSEISDLFAKDPLHLTNLDLTKIITHFRASRAAFMASGTRAKAETAAPKAKGPKRTAIAIDELDL